MKTTFGQRVMDRQEGMPRRQDDYGSGRSADWRPHDTDRSIDPFDDGLRSTRPPSSRPGVPPPSRPAASRPAASGATVARPPAGRSRIVDLRTVTPRPEAVAFGERWDRDPRQLLSAVGRLHASLATLTPI